MKNIQSLNVQILSMIFHKFSKYENNLILTKFTSIHILFDKTDKTKTMGTNPKF